jgi:hypothetical protein
MCIARERGCPGTFVNACGAASQSSQSTRARAAPRLSMSPAWICDPNVEVRRLRIEGWRLA